MSDAVEFAEQIVARFKELDLELAREHADVDSASILAECHVGLGIRMIMECGWSVEEVVALVKSLAAEVAEDLPERN